VNRGVKQKLDREQQHNKSNTFLLMAHTNNDMTSKVNMPSSK